MLTTTDALIIRVLPTGDNDRLLTLLTAEEGRISVMAKGGRSMHSNQLSLCQPFSFVNVELYRKGDLYWLRGGNVSCRFYHLTQDLDALNLATYLCDVAFDVSGEGVPAGDLLRLLLNSLYALDGQKKDPRMIKAAFEWRAALGEGYAPDLHGCAVCGAEIPESSYLRVMDGDMICAGCLSACAAGPRSAADEAECGRSILVGMCDTVLSALRYMANADLAKLLSFSLPDDEMNELTQVCETYLLHHLEHGFDSLDFYKSMKLPAGASDAPGRI